MAWLKGRGVASVNYPTGMNLGGDPSQALIHATTTGSFVITLSSVDLGQGIKTVGAQIAAETLGVPYDSVMIDTADTDTGPHCMGTFASRGTHRIGNAIIMAAREAREVMLEVAATELEVDAGDLVTDGKGRIHVNGAPDRGIGVLDVALAAHFKHGRTISGRGMYMKPKSEVVPETGEMDPDSLPGARLHRGRGRGRRRDRRGARPEAHQRLRDRPRRQPGARPPADRRRRLDGHQPRALRDHRALLPRPQVRPDRLLAVPDARPRRHRRDGERHHRAPRRQRPLRRQGHRRDDGQLADPGHRQRHLRRLRRAGDDAADHAGEGAARARRARARQ